jgi:RNA polymerase sigma factor (sigma-70 family)
MPTILSSFSDSELLANYRTTSNAACIGELFRRYRHLVLGVCVKYLKNLNDSEDAVMEIFEKLHLDLKRVEVEQFKAWLHTVARNHCLMRLRKVGLVVHFPETLPSTPSDDDDDEAAEEQAIKEILLQKIEKNLKKLKEEHKKCLTLFYLEDKSYKQIVQQTGYSLNEVKSFIQNGKANLKKGIHAN